jgi:hypothetical protein
MKIFTKNNSNGKILFLSRKKHGNSSGDDSHDHGDGRMIMVVEKIYYSLQLFICLI